MIDPGKADPLRARRLLARYGAGLLFDLLDHKEADLRGKGKPQERGPRKARAVSGGRARSNSEALTASPTSPSAATT